MTTATFEAVVTRAVVRLLLGTRKLKPGVFVTAGDPLDIDGRIWLGQQAVDADIDLVHVEYLTGPSPALTGVMLFLPRGGRCHIQTGCRLWLSQSGKRGAIVPQSHVRGHFRLAPGEIVHVDRKPADDLNDGIERASVWLARQVTRPNIAYDETQCAVWAKAA
jgi:hypothetical protein